MTSGPDQSPLIDEQLSAWLDDELPGHELELLATRLARSPELQARIGRYSLIGTALRDGAVKSPAAGLAALQVSSRVAAGLDELATAAEPVRPGKARRPARYAAAAAIALIAVGLVPVLRSALAPGVSPGIGLPEAVSLQTSGVTGSVTRFQVQSLVAEPAGAGSEPSLSSRRLTNYLVYHGEYSGMLSAKLTDSHIVNNRSYAVALQPASLPVSR